MRKSVRAKKHLGQHFLADRNIARKIVDALSGDFQNVLEVGPGTGILTEFLLAKNIENYFGIDLDKESVDFLQEEYSGYKSRFIYADFLKFDLQKLYKEEDFCVIGNFPYNISGPILFRILDYREQIPEAVGMFQKEVVERIISPPGTKQYGILSVLLQTYYETEMLFRVSNKVFVPPPKVQSAVLRLRRKESPDDISFPLLKDIVKTAFQQRRKTLRNALKKFPINTSDEIARFLSLRAEQLSSQDFLQLCRLLQKNGK